MNTSNTKTYQNQIKLLIKRRPLIPRLSPRINQLRPIRRRRRKVASFPKRLVELNIQYLVQPVVDVRVDVFLRPFEAVRVEVFGVRRAGGPAVHARFGVPVEVAVGAPVERGGELVVAAELVGAVVAALEVEGLVCGIV